MGRTPWSAADALVGLFHEWGIISDPREPARGADRGPEIRPTGKVVQLIPGPYTSLRPPDVEPA